MAFLNTADPSGRDPHDLYDATESGAAWPKYGQIDMATRAARRQPTTRSRDPAWAAKPYGFAKLPARGPLRQLRSTTVACSPRARAARAAFRSSPVSVQLSHETETRHVRHDPPQGDPRAQDAGFVIPSQDEWTKAAYYDPSGGGTLSYWKYPTNAGTFGDGTASAPATTTLGADDRRRDQRLHATARDLPLVDRAGADVVPRPRAAGERLREREPVQRSTRPPTRRPTRAR